MDITFENQRLNDLKKAYVNEKKPGFSASLSPEMRRLKSNISRINRLYKRPNDYTQCKYYIKEKIKKDVKVPHTYYYGDNLELLRNEIRKRDEMVIKPNHLSQGVGIRVLTKMNDGKYQDINNDILTIQDIIDECKIILNIKRLNAKRKIIVEERIRSHSFFGTNNGTIADIRMIFYDKNFLWANMRVPSSSSGGYSNLSRGADVSYVSDDGDFVDSNDERFQKRFYRKGKIPFFKDLVDTGKKVSNLYGLKFQTVDMTVNDKGEVLVIECEELPQIETSLTPKGADWLNSIISKDIEISKMKYELLLFYRRVSNVIQRKIYKYPKDY